MATVIVTRTWVRLLVVIIKRARGRSPSKGCEVIGTVSTSDTAETQRAANAVHGVERRGIHRVEGKDCRGRSGGPEGIGALLYNGGGGEGARG